MSRTKLIIGSVVLIALLGISTFVVVKDLKAPVEEMENSTASTTTTSGMVVQTYTLADVALHAAVSDCWTAVNGKVYNLTPFVDKHPGGVQAISAICGKDGTSLFTNQHGGQQRPEAELAKAFVGNLK